MTSKSHSGISDAAAGRARTANLRRSCETCRALKARCVVESVGGCQQRRCQRCISNDLECVFENTFARPKKLNTSSRARVKDVEEKLDGLIALISSQKEQEADSVITAPTPSFKSLEPQSTFPTIFQLSSPPPPSSNFSFDVFDLEPSCLESHTPQDVISRGIVSVELVNQWLADYMAGIEQFPFILLKPFMTLDYLRRERPCLLLSVLVMSSDTPHQDRLAFEFRKMIAEALIVESQKSLDLLQGLLVFCAWHHRYFNPHHQNLYQLSQIAVSMAVDLNLPTMGQAMEQFPSLDAQFGRRAQKARYWDEVDRIRTYLGTYYLSSRIAMTNQKPTHFKHNKQIEEGCQYLATVQDAPTDSLLPYHMRVRRLADDVERLFQYNDPHGCCNMDAVRIDAMVKAFERELEQIKESLPAEAWNNTSLNLALLYMPIFINEVGLKIPPSHLSLHTQTSSNPPTSASIALAAPCCNWCASPTRLSIILSCVRAAQAFISAYISLPTQQLRNATFFEVNHHIDAIIVLARVTISQDTQALLNLDGAAGNAIREAANVPHYLAESERKMGSLVRVLPDGREKQDYFWQLRQVFRHTIAWYTKQVDRAGAVVDLADGCRLAEAFKGVLHNERPTLQLEPDAAVALCETQYGLGGPGGGGQNGWTLASQGLWPFTTPEQGSWR